MQFQPKTEKEIQEENLIPDGVYPFEVQQAEDKTSKTSGNEMIELNIKIFKDDGGFIFVRDYLLESMPGKLRHAAYVMGLDNQYESGSLLARDFLDRTGYCKITTQKGKGDYPDRNQVSDYVQTPAGKANPVKQDLDDEIPF